GKTNGLYACRGSLGRVIAITRSRRIARIEATRFAHRDGGDTHSVEANLSFRTDNAAPTAVLGIFHRVHALALTISEAGRAGTLASVTDLVRPADKAALAAVVDIHVGVYA